MVVAVEHEVELFGVGSSLREARLRRGIELRQVEAATCIRAVNLELIEQERFDELPGDVYAAGFVRSYADFLGLDADRFVLLFRESRVPEPGPIVHEAVTLGPPASRAPLLVLVALLAIAAAAGAFLFLRGSGGAKPVAPVPAAAPAPKPAAKPAPTLSGALTIRAVRGDSWIVVRFGSSKGRLVWQGTLTRGHRLRFGLDRPLFVGFGKPEAVVVAAGDKRLRLARSHSLFVFGRDGVRTTRA